MRAQQAGGQDQRQRIAIPSAQRLEPREPVLIPQWPKDIVPPWYRRRATLRRIAVMVGALLVVAWLVARVDWDVVSSWLVDLAR